MTLPNALPLPGDAMDRSALLAALRARSARPGSSGIARSGGDSVPLCAAIDQSLPGGGLARAAMHEVIAADPGAAAGFCTLVLARAGTAVDGTVVWIAPEPDAWPSSPTRFGLAPADLLLVQAPRPQDAVWAMEECLRSPGIAGALLAAGGLDPTAARRLQLAAEAGGAIGLLLRPEEEAEEGPPAALTQWRIGALAGNGTPFPAGPRTVGGVGSAHGLGDPRWHLDLLRPRSGRTQHWDVTWRPAAERLDLDDGEAEVGHEAAPAPASRRTR
jgi:protein ImuA